MIANKIYDKIFSIVISTLSFVLMAICVVFIIINSNKKPIPGDDGLDGKSAYEIAVENGYTGTEQEWLQSLVGSSDANGVGIVDVTVNEDGDIVIKLSSGEIIVCGGHSEKCVHEYDDEWDIISEASCENLGIKIRSCTKCEYKDYQISLKLDHSYLDNVILPTCTSKGYTEHICENCGKTYKDEETEQLDHQYEFLYEIVSNCKEHKVLEQCKLCLNTQPVDKEPVSEHNYVNYVCTVCGHSLITPDELFVFELLENDTYKVSSKYVNELPETVIIPSVYQDKLVTEISDSAFINGKQIKKIVLPESIVKIGRSAFEGCENLRTLNLPEGITELPYSVFSNCKNLTNLTLPTSLEIIGTLAFYNCNSIEVLTLPLSIKSIEDFAFFECSKLAFIENNSQLESIGNGAFTGCISLVNFVIPETVVSMGSYVFKNCILLTIKINLEAIPESWHDNWNQDNCPVEFIKK